MEVNKNTIGQAFFALSILMLIYMLISPLNQVLSNVSEFFTLTLINFPISDLLHILGGDTNPPLYFLLLKAVSKIIPDFAILKVFSIIPYAIILILSTLKLRKDYGWLTAGLFAFAIATMSEFLMTYSLLRPYSWAMLFIVLAFIFFRDIIADGDTKSFVLFTIFAVLASYTHYYGLIASIVLYLILLAHILTYNRDKIKYLAISIVAAIVLYAPWMLTLVKLLESMNPLSSITTDSIIQAFAHFAYSADTIFSVVTIAIFLIILAVYLMQKDEDTKFVLYGTTAYFATIAIIILISIIFKPILATTGLVLVSAILWLVISIMISKIKGKRIFLISLALICLLLIGGIATAAVANNDAYQSGAKQNEAIDSIVQDNNSMVILTNPGLAMYFMDFAKNVDMYCVNQDYIYGENINRLHEIFAFKTVEKDNITDLARNNTDKNIYLISWGNPDVDLNVSLVSNELGTTISKVNTTGLAYDEYNDYEDYYYY